MEPLLLDQQWAVASSLDEGRTPVHLWQGVSAPERRKEGGDFVENAFPRCRKCSEGDLVPLSDFGSQGASIEYKAWVCTNPSCLYNIKIRNGDIIINEPISDGSLHTYRSGRQ